jgi:orotate phosphoribosyltransferase
MLDDVLTSGKAIRGAAELIRAQDADVAGVVVALDRAEVMADAGQTAVADLAQELAAPVVSIAHVTDVISYLQKTDAESDVLQAMHAYTRQCCVL